MVIEGIFSAKDIYAGYQKFFFTASSLHRPGSLVLPLEFFPNYISKCFVENVLANDRSNREERWEWVKEDRIQNCIDRLHGKMKLGDSKWSKTPDPDRMGLTLQPRVRSEVTG